MKIAVELDASTVNGTLLDVEGPLLRTPGEKGTPTVVVPHFALTLLTEQGALERHTTQGMRSLKAEDAAVSGRLEAAVRTLARTRAQQPNPLDLQLKKGGRLGLGYLADAPVWRVS